MPGPSRAQARPGLERSSARCTGDGAVADRPGRHRSAAAFILCEQPEFVVGDLIRPNRSSALRLSCNRRRSDRAVRSLSERTVAEVYDAVSASALIEELKVG